MTGSNHDPGHTPTHKLLDLWWRQSIKNTWSLELSRGEGGVHGELAYVVNTGMQGSSLDKYIRLQ